MNAHKASFCFFLILFLGQLHGKIYECMTCILHICLSILLQSKKLTKSHGSFPVLVYSIQTAKLIPSCQIVTPVKIWWSFQSNFQPFMNCGVDSSKSNSFEYLCWHWHTETKFGYLVSKKSKRLFIFWGGGSVLNWPLADYQGQIISDLGEATGQKAHWQNINRWRRKSCTLRNNSTQTTYV